MLLLCPSQSHQRLGLTAVRCHCALQSMQHHISLLCASFVPLGHTRECLRHNAPQHMVVGVAESFMQLPTSALVWVHVAVTAVNTCDHGNMCVGGQDIDRRMLKEEAVCVRTPHSACWVHTSCHSMHECVPRRTGRANEVNTLSERQGRYARTRPCRSAPTRQTQSVLSGTGCCSPRGC